MIFRKAKIKFSDGDRVTTVEDAIGTVLFSLDNGTSFAVQLDEDYYDHMTDDGVREYFAIDLEPM